MKTDILTPEQKSETAEWFRTDAAYLERQAAVYAARGEQWLADKVSANAKHSAQRANELTLAPPESVADQAARQAREATQANQRAQRQTVQDRAAAPLVGTRGDLGQADMLGGSDLWGGAQ